MTSKLDVPMIVKPEDIDPGHDWSRALRAPGMVNVDFEERVNFRRLYDYPSPRIDSSDFVAIPKRIEARSSDVDGCR